MESGSSKPTHQDTAQDGATVRSISERTAGRRNQATEIASSSSSVQPGGKGGITDSPAVMNPSAVLMQPSQCDQGLQSGSETLRLASSPPSVDAEQLTVSRSFRVPGPTAESACSPVGSIALNASRPLVLIKQGSPSEKLFLYAHGATGTNFQGSLPLNLKKVAISQNDASCVEKVTSVTVSSNKETVDVGGNGKPPSSLNPQDSNLEDTELATLQGKSQSKEVPASPLISLRSAKSTDECFLGQLGLKKVEESLQASSKTEDAVTKEHAGKYRSGRGVDQQRVGEKDGSGDSRISKEESFKEHDAQVKSSPGQVPQPKLPQANQPPKAVPVAASKVPTMVISHVGDNNSLAKVDISGLSNVLSKDGQASSVPTSNAPTVFGKNTPIYIKVKLEEKDVTVICCPVALLLQHKEILDVTLQANDPNAYSIKCRKCLHEVSEPYAMLQHLKAQHQIQGCLQKLLNLNSQHLGCMSKPVCVNIPGVLTLPDGLSDMEQGVIRFNSLGIPRLSFVCRLCPLNFHSARGLSSHHQYFIRSLYNKSQHSVNNSRWFCRMCPRQFRNFSDYYAHHKWMRVAKDLFVNTDQVSKKKFQVMDESGKVVASVEVPKSHNLPIKTCPAANCDSSENIGWGRKPSLLDDGSPLGRLDPLVPDMNEHSLDNDAQILVFNTAIPISTSEGTSYKQQTEAEKEKKTAPPLFQTLDSLCRRLAQRVDSSTSLDKLISVGDKQVDDDHEYMCGICHKTFPRLPQMQGHMGSHVRKRRTNKSVPPALATIATPQADPPSVEPPPAPEPVDVEYKCGVCHKTFPKLAQMQIHSECHNRSHPANKKRMKSLDTPFLETVKLMSFTCDMCQWSFPTETKLWDHRRIHNQKKIDDDETNMFSKASGDVQRKTLFVCAYCKKSFARQVNLLFHLKKHGTEQFPPGLNRVSTCSSLRVKEETGEVQMIASHNPDLESRSHACSLCGSAFHSQRQLKSHKAWHAKVQKGSDEPPVSLMETGSTSKNTYICNTCNKICSSFGELHDHTKQHATPRRLLVRYSLDESDAVKKRTLAQRACKEKKNKDASDADAPSNKKKGRSTRRKTEGLFKFFCRNCRSYFKSSQQFARHMAVHSNLAGSNSRSSSDSPSKISEDPAHKLKEIEVSGDDSSDETDVSRSTSPNAADDQPLVIDKASPQTGENLAEEEVGEVTKNSEVNEDSSLAVEDTSQTLKKSVTDEQSPQASDKSTEEKYIDPVVTSTVCRYAEMENAGKQNSSDEDFSQTCDESGEKRLEAGCVDSKVGKETSPMLVDTNNDASLNETMEGTGEGKLAKNSLVHQGTVSTVENIGYSATLKSPAEIVSEDEKERARSRSPTIQVMPCDSTNVVMVGMCQEARPSTPNKQPSENCGAHSLVDDQSLQKHMADSSTQSTDCDNSLAVIENNDQGATPISIKESEASPTVNEEHVQSTEESVRKESTRMTVQTAITDDLSIVVEETTPEDGSSLTDAYSCKSSSSDNKNLKISQVLTKKQQDDQLPDPQKREKDSCAKMETGSQESIADEPLFLMVTDSPQTTPPTLDASSPVSCNVELSEKSGTVMDTGSQKTRPNMHEAPLLVSRVKLPDEDSFAMVVAESQETSPIISDAPPLVISNADPDEDSTAAMDTESQESRQSIHDAPPILSCEVHPHISNESTLREGNDPGANPAHGSSSSLMLEDTKMPTIHKTAELPYSEGETSWLETSSVQKQDVKLLEDSADGDNVQSCKAPDSDFSEPHSAAIDDSRTVEEDNSQGSKPCTLETKSQENEIGQSKSLEEPEQQQDDEIKVKLQLASDDEDTTNQVPALGQVAEPVAVDDSDSVAVDSSEETKPLTCDVKLLKSCEVPTVKEDSKSTDYSTAYDASVGGVVGMNASQEAKTSSSDAVFAENKMGQSHTSELPAQESDKLTRDVTVTVNSDVSQEADQSNASPLETLGGLPQTNNASIDEPKDAELPKDIADCDDSAVLQKASPATRPSIFEAMTQNITKPSEVPMQVSDGGISTPSRVGDESSSLLEDTGREAGPTESPYEEGEKWGFPRNMPRFACDICNKSFPKKAQLRGHMVNHRRYGAGPKISQDNSDSTVEASADEPVEFTVLKDAEHDTGNSSSSLPMKGDELQEKSAHDLPANSTDSVDPVAEVISVNQQVRQNICDAQMAPNLQSGASLSQIKEKPSQQLDPDSEIGDQSTAVSGSAGEEVRKAASDADTDKLSQDKAITLRSTTRKSEVDASSEAHPTDLSQNHQTLAHSKRNDGEKKPLSCPHCEKTYTRINQLNAHKRIHMRGSKLYKDNNGSTDGAKGKGRKVHKCPICHALFYNYKKFCGHRGAHIAHKTTQFRKYNMASQESNCKESSQSKPKVLEPKVTDSTSAGGSKKLAGKFTCKFCPETFQNVAQLRNHILVTHPMTKGKPFLLKPFTCELCGKSFTKSKQRQLHMKLHGKRRRRRFKRTMSLQDSDHSYYKKLPAQRGNTSAEGVETQKPKVEREERKISEEEKAIPDVEAPKEKVFKCRVCDRSFKNQYQVAGHMSIHKRYPCQFCPASFTLARQLCGHLKVHGGSRKKVMEESPSLDGENHSSGFKASQSSLLYMASQRKTQFTSSSQSNALLKRVIKVFLTGPKSKKRRLKGKAGKWLQPKGSLKRALMKHQQAQMQNIIGILRKSIILEIDADSHRLVYECKGCQKIAYCHKNILRHYLEKHLQSTIGMEDVPQVASTRREDAMPAPNPRFRNKSKIGCPICKVSSGFQCHLHNEDELIAIDAFLRHDDDQEVLACDSGDESFSRHSKLVQHRRDHAKRQPGEPFRCSQCPFQAKCIQSLMDHQQFHSEKREEKLPKEAPDGEKLISCPHCSFKVKNVFGLAAHSRVHKGEVRESEKSISCPDCSFKVKNVFGLAAHSRVHKDKGQKRALEDERQSPAPSSSPSPAPSLEVSPENTQASSDGTKHRKNAYNCFACPRYFYTVKAYQNHMKCHEQYFQFKCSVCSSSFLSLRMLDDHIKSAHSVKLPYTCNECSFSSQSFEAIQSHIHVHSEAKEKKERQANWSAYLKAVLQRKVPESTSVSLDERLTEHTTHPSNVLNYDPQAQSQHQLERSWIASNLHPERVKNHTATYSEHEDPTMRKAKPKFVMDINTLSVDKQAEDNPHQQSDSPDEYFACSQCKDFRASTKGEWDSHIAIVHNGGSGPKKLRCSMCQYTTINQERLEQHRRLHRHQTLQCNSCTYRTPMRHLMIRHVQTVHRQHRPFQCKLCTYATAYRHHLRRHAEKHKNPNFRCRYRKLMKKGDWQTAEASNRVICKICGRELQNKKTLRSHCIKVHNRIPGDKNLQYVQDDFSSGEIKPGTRYQPSYSIIVEDVAPAQIEKMYECSVCSFKFKRRSDLNQHMAQGHVEAQASLPCQCPQCGLVTGSGQLQHHMLVHQEENLFQCGEEGCDFKTAQAVHLQRHQNKHAAERDVLITCRYCHVKFPDASSLQIHNVQVHSERTNTIGTRTPFLCSLCPFTSTNEKDANRHFKLHNYNLAFKCEYCVFSSSTASAIATHQKIHRYPRRNPSTTLVSKKASQQQRQRITSSTSVKSGDSQNSPVVGIIPERPRPKHVFVSNKGKKLYECRYCQRFFDVAEAWQRHELRHMTEWPQY